ncbi:MAG: ferritin [Cyclobacteriaceae bacterium]
MKDLIRRRMTIKDEIYHILLEQIKMEAHSSASYLAIASWCDHNGYENSADFFYQQSDEERAHMLRIFHYVSDMGGAAVSPSIPEIPSEYGSLREVFESALDQEIKVSESINKVVNKCRKSDDFATESFMQWFIKEQIEEEYIARRAVELFDLFGTDPLSIMMIDERIPKIKYSDGTDGSV